MNASVARARELRREIDSRAERVRHLEEHVRLHGYNAAFSTWDLKREIRALELELTALAVSEGA